MPVSAIAALMILTTVILSACAQEKGAQLAVVEDKSTQYYGRNPMFSSSTATFQSAAVEPIASAPLASPTLQNTSSMLAPSRPALTSITPASADGWMWPVNGRVTVPFGQQAEGIANEGITIAAPAGSAIKAAAGGEIAYVGTHVRDYGNMVIVRHPGGQLTSYAHARDIIVAKGDRVHKGTVLGYVGQTGNARAPQLHFAMREGSGVIDPTSKLPSQLASR